MTKHDLLSILGRLGLNQAEAATLLSVNPRTMRRWIEDPEEIPGPAEQALRAWDKLHRLGMAWRPDGLDLAPESDAYADQVARLRLHAIGLADTISKVEARGGPRAPWTVDLKNNEATLGKMTVHFYRLPNGGWSPASYTRTDIQPDANRDAHLIDDAYACIAVALAKKH